MPHVLRVAWSALVLAAGAAPALGQGVGTSGSSGSSSSGGLSGLSSSLGGGGSSGSLGGSSASSGSALASMPQAPTLSAPSSYASTGSTTNTAINTSNFLGPYFANVYYQGRAGAQLTQQPGGFGVSLYGSSGSGATGGGNIGFAGNPGGGLGGSGGGSSSLGGAGRTGTGGAGSSSGGINLNNPGGQIVQLPRSIAYPALVKFQAPLPAPSQVNADIRAMLDRSTMIGSPQNLQVISEGNIIVLRGAVRDEDESHMVEGMIRLTPGVHAVRNELSYPR